MPRANRHHIPGQVWHITHRCHKRDFLFRFTKDRTCWLQWLHEAKKRYNLCIFNYMVTSNHIHLLVADDKSDVISSSIQLIAGRTALGEGDGQRRPKWTKAVAVGSEMFVSQIKQKMGILPGRMVEQIKDAHVLREPESAYSVHLSGEKVDLSLSSSLEGLRGHRGCYAEYPETQALY